MVLCTVPACCRNSAPPAGGVVAAAGGVGSRGAGGSLATGPGWSARVGGASRFCRGRAGQGREIGCHLELGVTMVIVSHEQWSPW